MSTLRKGVVVDAKCRDLTSALAVEAHKQDPSVQVCSFHEASFSETLFAYSMLTFQQELENFEPCNLIGPGIWTFDDVKDYGKKKGVCPYFTIRRMVFHFYTINVTAPHSI